MVIDYGKNWQNTLPAIRSMLYFGGGKNRQCASSARTETSYGETRASININVRKNYGHKQKSKSN